MKTLVICILLGLSSLFSTQVVAKSLANKGVGVAQNWLEMTRIYQESSVVAFNEVLAALLMDVTEFANKSGLHDGRLRSYMNGELFLDEVELDTIELFVNDVKQIVRKFYGDDTLSLTIKARKLLWGGVDIAKFRRYAQIETDAHELIESGDELTPEQEKLVNKVDAIRNDALARIKHTVTLGDINYYRNKEQVSSQILTEILNYLHLSEAELAQRASLDTATIAAHQSGEIIFAADDIKKINTALEYAIDKSPPKLRRWKRRSSTRMDKNTHDQTEAALQLKRLLQDFNAAVRVERYLRDPQRRVDD